MKFLLINTLLLLFYSHAYSQDKHDEILSKAIQKQVISASNCETIANGLATENLAANDFFEDCVGRRALMIAMQIKHGPGKYGQINVFDKIDAYFYLGASTNVRVQKIANSYSTAAGGN